MQEFLKIWTSTERLLEVAAYCVYAFAVSVAVTAIYARWRRTRDRKVGRAALLEARAREIRRLARRTYGLKHELKTAEATLREIETKCSELEKHIERRRNSRKAIFMLHETRRPEDHLFEADVRHRQRIVPEPFKDQLRTYAVWAPDERKAQARLMMSFREDAGYSISPVRRRASVPPAL